MKRKEEAQRQSATVWWPLAAGSGKDDEMADMMAGLDGWTAAAAYVHVHSYAYVRKGTRIYCRKHRIGDVDVMLLRRFINALQIQR